MQATCCGLVHRRSHRRGSADLSAEVRGVDGSLSKLSFKKLLDMVDAAEGKEFLKFMEFLNTENEKDVTTADVEKHVTGVVNFLNTASDNKAEVLRKVAMSASRLYMGPMSLLELTSLVNDRATWADSVDKKAASAELKAWMKDAKSVKKLAAAIASGYKSRRGERQRRRQRVLSWSQQQKEQERQEEGGQQQGEKQQEAVLVVIGLIHEVQEGQEGEEGQEG